LAQGLLKHTAMPHPSRHAPLHQSFPIHTLHSGSEFLTDPNLYPSVAVLYAQGSKEAFAILNQLPKNGLAVVGTRTPDSRSLLLLEENIEILQESGLVILSGLARGIDQWAHQYALKYQLPTIGILGCGHNFPYPRETLRLREKILEQDGLILSEWTADAGALPYQFLARNRILANLASAIWIVQAGDPSGALNTAKWGVELNRDVYATPSFPGDLRLAGNQRLLERSEAMSFFSSQSLKSTWPNLGVLTRDQATRQIHR